MRFTFGIGLRQSSLEMYILNSVTKLYEPRTDSILLPFKAAPFNNFQWSTTSRDVKDGNAAHITREPEQVKAFRDTWHDSIHFLYMALRGFLWNPHREEPK